MIQSSFKEDGDGIDSVAGGTMVGDVSKVIYYPLNLRLSILLGLSDNLKCQGSDSLYPMSLQNSVFGDPAWHHIQSSLAGTNRNTFSFGFVSPNCSRAAFSAASG